MAGVEGLQYFLEHHCPTACYSVNIPELVNRVRLDRRPCNQEIVIAVDADSCNTLFHKGIDWLDGFEIQEYIHQLSAFVQCFKNLGVRLIFFFGGSISEKKREIWIQRRRKKLEYVYSVFDAINAGRIDLTEPIRGPIKPDTGVDTAFIMKKVLGCEVHMSVKECDEEIIEYVHKYKCFAIFGQNTNFVLSQAVFGRKEAGVAVLSADHFQMSNMTTLLYNGVELAKHLGIRPQQLPLFAVLATINDLIPLNDKIVNFHRKLLHNYYNHNTTEGTLPLQILMPAVVRYIKEVLNKGPGGINQILEFICENFFGDLSQLDIIKTSYSSYFVSNTPVYTSQKADGWSEILAVARFQHINLMVPSVLYSILNDQTYEEDVAFEDLRLIVGENLPLRYLSSAAITRPLRLNLYGILLFEKSHSPATVREWCGLNINSYLEPTIVQSLKPAVSHPGLRSLWSPGYCIDTRRRLFLNSVWSTLGAPAWYWTTFGEELLLPTLSVYYLYKMKYLEELEMDAALATIALYPVYGRMIVSDLTNDLKSNLRASHITLTLRRTFGLILALSAACGYPLPLSKDNAFLKFEGKVFQVKYRSSVEQRHQYDVLCDKNERAIEKFVLMKDFILNYESPEAPGTSSSTRQ